MNTSFFKIIIAIFIVLAGIALLPMLFGKSETQNASGLKNVSVDFSHFGESSVKEIRIAKGDDVKVLSRREKNWNINDVEADPEKIGQLFADFSAMRIEDMVSQNSENQSKFGVTKEKGIELTLSLSDSKDPQIFFVGNQGPAVDSFYIRKDGIKNTYLANGKLRALLLQSVDDWKKKSETDAGKSDSVSSTTSEQPLRSTDVK